METTNRVKQAFWAIFGFKPTYKGWKLLPVPQDSALPIRFKPTYKGWKRVGRRGGPLRRKVLSLPTRDGNNVIFAPGSAGSSRFKPTYKGWKLVSLETGDWTEWEF